MADLCCIGAQSFSFRNFDLEGSLRCLRELGLRHMEFCGVHFPADVSDAGFEEVREAIARAAVAVPSYGVEGFAADEADNRRRFVFAQAMCADVLSADPAPEAFDSLDKLCEEFQIKIAIHNHGPGARYDSVEDTLNAVKDRHPFIGACVDTGHYLRSGVAPHEALLALGERVHSVHLKDWIIGGEEQIVGKGDMDLEKVAQALKDIDFDGPILFEYEMSPSNPVADMQQGLANWRAVQ